MLSHTYTLVFYNIYSIGVAGIAAGFLVGASKIDYIMILPNENAVKQFTGKGQLRLGGELQLAVGPVMYTCMHV